METFDVFREWSLKNGYRDDLSIDRIDVNGNYEPSNCKWSTGFEQARNKRTSRYITINRETKTVAEWAEISGVPYKTLQRRIYTGCKEENLLAPKGYQYKNHKHIEINGEKKLINVWAKESGIPYSTIKRRYEKGIRGSDLLKKGRLNKQNDFQMSFDLD